MDIKALEETLDHLNIGISIHSVDGEVLEANGALGRLLDMPLDSIIGKKCYKVFHLKDSFVPNCPQRQSINSKKPEAHEFLLQQVEKWLNFETIPILDDAGKVSKILHIVMDITRKKELESAYTEIKMLDKMKEELITNVSHELRTPLQVVQMALEIMSDEVTDKDLMGRAIENLYRLNDLIGDIMSTVKMREQLLPSQEVVNINRPASPLIIPVEVVERMPVDVVETLKRSVAKFSQKIEKNELKVEYMIDDDVPKILGDERELGIAFSHLIDNAVKFNKKGGSITLEVQNSGDKVVMKFTDTGIGISASQLPKIFERFYQGDGSTTRKFEGTGLGLYLVKSYVKRHKGNIWADSVVGSGTTFTMVLPCM